MRKCKRCEAEKPDDAFEILNADRGWRRGVCRDCHAQYHRDWRRESKDHIRERRRRYHQENRERIIAKVMDWTKANPERKRKHALDHYYRLQDRAITAYGGYKCSWCGIDEPLVLCIDHVGNDGNSQRKKHGTGGRFYKWLADNNYPSGFQVLCMNCNHAKYRNDGEIPQSLKGRCNDYPQGVPPSGGKRAAPRKRG